MPAKHEKSQGTKLRISKYPAAAVGDTSNDDFYELSCTVTNINVEPGQTGDISITTLCSTAEEQTDALAAAGEITFDMNFISDDPGQNKLREIRKTGAVHEFEIIFKSGYKFACIAKNRGAPVTVAVNDILKTSATLRIMEDSLVFEKI